MKRWNFASVAGLNLLIASALGGPLNPPPGPVAPTPGPEPRTAINAINTPGDTDSLFRISQPGSYYLTGNITGVVGKHGVQISANGVTLDLMGFHLVGVPAMGAFDGVTADAVGLTDIAVINGSIRNWGSDGVAIGTSNFGGRVEGVHASGNANDGISAPNSSIVSNCSTYLNGGDGIQAFSGVTITNCSAAENAADGITVTNSGTITNCTVYSNGSDGISSTGGSTLIEACTVYLNFLDGIRCTVGCVIRDNNCSGNGNGGDGSGIHVNGSNNRIEGNQCTSADRGIDVDLAGNIIIRNTCSNNTTNWVFVANNYHGPIIDRTGVVTAAVNGPAAAGTLNSTDPHANFSY